MGLVVGSCNMWMRSGEHVLGAENIWGLGLAAAVQATAHTYLHLECDSMGVRLAGDKCADLFVAAFGRHTIMAGTTVQQGHV